MTPEQKLNHLRDWMNCWIDAKCSTISHINAFFGFYEQFGIMLPTIGAELNVVPFEKYLQLIDIQH